MPPANEKLAAALEELQALQKDGARVFSSDQFSRIARERLVEHGWLQEVMRGWLLSSSPTTRPGDTTPWFASFWDFCARYCTDRFGTNWCLSPAQSLLLHAENTTIPKQVIIHSSGGTNNVVELLFGTSFFTLRERAMPDADDIEIRGGLRVYTVAAALIRVQEDFFAQHPVEAQIAARSIRDASPLLTRLLAGHHATIAGRLAGLYRRLERPKIADEIVATMRAAHHDVRVVDPLDEDAVITSLPSNAPPIVARLQALWAAAREQVIAEFPDAPGRPKSTGAYLAAIDGVYKLDAYHSLSIEGYQVTPELIERVKQGWDSDTQHGDRHDLDALAARGYWQAFQHVRDTVHQIVNRNAGADVVRESHRQWYRELFTPHVAVGVTRATALAGYRNGPVYILGSRHVPPRRELLPDAMSTLFDLIENDPAPAVRAVLGHWLFGYVHPFPDGNGRIARFVMNALLAGGGYPWTVIQVERRTEYMRALETASTTGDARPFAKFIASQMTPTTTRPKRRAR